MTSKQLLEYVKRARAQGATDAQIRNALLAAGHSPEDVANALKPKRVVRTKTLAIMLAVLALLALVVFASIKFLAKPKSIELLLSVQQQTAVPGENVIATVTLSSEQAKRVPVRVSFELVHEETGRTVSTRLARQDVGRSAVISESLSLPKNTPPGNYAVKVRAKYDGREVSSAQSLSVITEREEREEVLPEEKEFLAPTFAECPPTCDDFNPCTRDYCEQGVCKHDLLKNCCGNNACEPGETARTCPEDCEKREAELGATMERAKRVVMTNPEQAALLCDGIGNRKNADKCFVEIAKTSKNSALCNPVSDDGVRDSCYLDFAFEMNDFSVCPRIKNRYFLTSCLAYANAQGATEQAG